MVAFQKIGWPVLSEMYVAEQSSMKILSIFFSVPDSCHNSCCCCSVAKLCPTLCDPMNCSTPSFPVLHFFLVCSNSCPLSQWCYLNHLSVLSSSPFACLLSQHQNLFQWVGSFHHVAPMNIQGWFPKGLTGLISLQSKGLSRAFSSTTVQKHSSALSLIYDPALTSVYDYWKNP